MEVAGQQRAFSANLQGAAFVFEHFLMPFMKEHISKLDPAFKGAEGTLRSVRPLASCCSAPALARQPVTWTQSGLCSVRALFPSFTR